MILTPALKLWFKEKWVYFLAVLPIIAYGLFRMFRKVPSTEVTSTNKASVDLQKKIGDLRTQAAFEIGKAQGREDAVKEEITKITEMPVVTPADQKKQLQELADLVNRTRRS